MANTEAGAAYVSIIPSMKGFDSKIASGIGDGLKKAAAVGGAAMAALGGAVLAVGKSALDSYSDYQQLTGGVEKIFGEAASTVQANASAAYATMGVSANTYMQQVTSFSASLKQSLGGDVVAAAERANTAMGDMADNASIFGTNMTDIQNAYQGFAKQNYTMLDNLKLGYGGTRSEMQRLIDDANAWGAANGKSSDLSIDSFADVVEAIHRIQEAQGIAGNSAAEASHTIAGSIQTLSASWENWLTGLGDSDADMSALTDQLLDSLGSVVENVAPIAAQIGERLVEGIPAVASKVGPALLPILSTALSTACNGAVAALSSVGIRLPTVDTSQVEAALQAVASAVGAAVGGIGEVLGGIASGFQAAFADPSVQAAVERLQEVVGPFYENVLVPIGSFIAGPLANAVGYLAGGAIALLITAVETVMTLLTDVSIAVQAVAGAFSSAGAMIQVAWDGVVSFFVGVWSSISSGLSAAATVASGAFSAAGSAIGGALSGVSSIASGVATSVGGFFQAAGSVVGGALSAAASAAQSAFGSMSGAASSVGSAIGGFFSSAAGVVGSAISGAASRANGAINGIAGVVSSVVGTIKGAFSGVADFIRNAFSSVKRIIEGAFRGIHIPTFHVSGGFNLDPGNFHLPSIEFYAEGGITNGLSVIGEAGREAIVPYTNSNIRPWARALADAAGLGGGGGTTVNQYVRIVRDDEDLYSAAAILNRSALAEL